MSVPYKGAFDPLSATEYNALVDALQPLRVVKGSDESKSSTTFASDSQITLTPAVNSTYKVMMWLKVNVAAGVNFKMQFSVPSNISGWWTIKNQTIAGATETVWQNDTTWAGNAQMIGSGADRPMEVFGLLVVGSTPGPIVLQWAPVSAGTAIVRANSLFELSKI